MIVSITCIELVSYTKLPAFMNLNVRIIKELKQSKCIKYKISAHWNLKKWYTMTLWASNEDINDFYKKGAHLEAIKQAKNFSNNMTFKRLEAENLLKWKKAKEIIHQ